MFRDADTRFHVPATVPSDWAETNFFYCYVPEHRVIAWVYLMARPGVGALKADVEINGDLSLDPWGAWYSDNQNHLRDSRAARVLRPAATDCRSARTRSATTASTTWASTAPSSTSTSRV